jgi:ribosomal-protein-serine acetyltransferase
MRLGEFVHRPGARLQSVQDGATGGIRERRKRRAELIDDHFRLWLTDWLNTAVVLSSDFLDAASYPLRRDACLSLFLPLSDAAQLRHCHRAIFAAQHGLRSRMLSLKINPGLELRLLQLDDAAELFALIDAHRAQLRIWLPWVDQTVKRAQTEKFIAKSLWKYRDSRAFAAGIWSDGRLVGVIRHNRIDWAARIAFPGWWLGPQAQGQGIMTACCQAVFAHAFTQLQVARIVVGVATGNVRGLSLVKRLGFSLIQTLSNAERLNGKNVDHFIYQLSPSMSAGMPAPGAEVFRSF